MPGIPHLVPVALASFCFAKSWPRMAHWVNLFFSAELHAWKTQGRIIISWRAKWLSLGLSLLSLTVLYFSVAYPTWLILSVLYAFSALILLLWPSK